MNLVKKIPDKEDEINPNIGAGYFGELINKYFSFAGFYKIIENREGKSMSLEKLKDTKIKPKIYETVEIVFPNNISALENFANSGVSLVKGKIDSKKFEGTLNKCIGERNAFLRIIK